MINRLRYITLFVLLLPLLALAAWAGALTYSHIKSPEYHVQIEGYDPRDILHGRYITFRYDWDTITPAKPDAALPETGRFYIPEQYGPDLDTMLAQGDYDFSVTFVLRGNVPQIKSLFIDDAPWQESLAAWRKKQDNTPHDQSF